MKLKRWMRLDQTLKEHRQIIEKHDDRIDHIQRDITDIKIRLGLKDISNGNVLKYQEELVKAQEQEREERKEQDRMLMELISRIDERIWYLVVGIILSVMLEIGIFIVQSHI